MNDITQRLQNWSRHYRSHVSLKTCGSAEKNFKSNWRQWMAFIDLPISSPVDVKDAEIIEKAWASIPVRRYRQILKMVHMTDLPDHAIALKAGTKIWRLKSDYTNAVSALARLL